METFQILTEAYGDKTSSCACVFEGHKWFPEVRNSVEDGEQAGSPRKPILPQLKMFRQNGESPEEPSKTLVPELLPAMAAPNA
ncbi:hypothetical protein TNCV_5101591 [Trichonephila clavipes]|nr:hypothetical protein TNCV_5101591 [Trichonephila clavipes]